MFFSRFALLALIAAVLVAATSTVARAQAPDAARIATTTTPYLNAIGRALRRVAPSTENRLWFMTYQNRLEDNWLLQTPDCWDRDCGAAGAQRLLDAIRTDIGSAKTHVDLVTMYPVPDGGFQDAI